MACCVPTRSPRSPANNRWSRAQTTSNAAFWPTRATMQRAMHTGGSSAYVHPSRFHCLRRSRSGARRSFRPTTCVSSKVKTTTTSRSPRDAWAHFEAFTTAPRQSGERRRAIETGSTAVQLASRMHRRRYRWQGMCTIQSHVGTRGEGEDRERQPPCLVCMRSEPGTRSQDRRSESLMPQSSSMYKLACVGVFQND